jgi:hypothetical protein
MVLLLYLSVQHTNITIKIATIFGLWQQFSKNKQEELKKKQ